MSDLVTLLEFTHKGIRLRVCIPPTGFPTGDTVRFFVGDLLVTRDVYQSVVQTLALDGAR